MVCRAALEPGGHKGGDKDKVVGMDAVDAGRADGDEHKIMGARWRWCRWRGWRGGWCSGTGDPEMNSLGHVSLCHV